MRSAIVTGAGQCEPKGGYLTGTGPLDRAERRLATSGQRFSGVRREESVKGNFG